MSVLDAPPGKGIKFFAEICINNVTKTKQNEKKKKEDEEEETKNKKTIKNEREKKHTLKNSK